jgi:hypothetical protein
VVGRGGLGLELADQVDVFVADRERLSEHIVQLVTESENESQDHQHHRGDESMKLIAFHGHPHDERDQRRHHKAVGATVPHITVQRMLAPRTIPSRPAIA